MSSEPSHTVYKCCQTYMYALFQIVLNVLSYTGPKNLPVGGEL